MCCCILKTIEQPTQNNDALENDITLYDLEPWEVQKKYRDSEAFDKDIMLKKYFLEDLELVAKHGTYSNYKKKIVLEEAIKASFFKFGFNRAISLANEARKELRKLDEIKRLEDTKPFANGDIKVEAKKEHVKNVLIGMKILASRKKEEVTNAKKEETGILYTDFLKATKRERVLASCLPLKR